MKIPVYIKLLYLQNLICSVILLMFFSTCTQKNSISPKEESKSINTIIQSKGPLLSTRFSTLDQLKEVVQIEYFNNETNSLINKNPSVQLSQSIQGAEIQSILETGVSEKDFTKARDGDYMDKALLALNSPYFVRHRNDLLRVFVLARRDFKTFGESDVAFYDLAETMLHQIIKEDFVTIDSIDLSEKGYINTFNHITAQTFMTVLFSEDVADFVADAHERKNLPELITGRFSSEQLEDMEKGPIDNYVDMINNEWGQELGKKLKEKYNIHRQTKWAPELLANFLNDIQAYYSWAFQLGFKPFTSENEKVISFSKKLNHVMDVN